MLLFSFSLLRRLHESYRSERGKTVNKSFIALGVAINISIFIKVKTNRNHRFIDVLALE